MWVCTYLNTIYNLCYFILEKKSKQWYTTNVSAEVMEWQTWRTQNPLVAIPCGFKSRLRHHDVYHLLIKDTLSVGGFCYVRKVLRGKGFWLLRFFGRKEWRVEIRNSRIKILSWWQTPWKRLGESFDFLVRVCILKGGVHWVADWTLSQ